MATKRFKIEAKAYDKRGQLLASGKNSYTKSHPLMQFFAHKVGLHEKIYLHAEVQALLRCGDKQPHKLVVERYKEDGSPAMVKPCPVCQEAIKAFGVKIVQYTCEGGTHEEAV